MSHKAPKKRTKNLMTDLSGFQSNEDRKREQRGAYHREYDGIGWMKAGYVPPSKGWARRVTK